MSLQRQGRLCDRIGDAHKRRIDRKDYAGLGIGLRPEGEIANAVRRGDLVRILPGYRFEALDVFAIMPKGTSKLPRIIRFLDAFSEGLSSEV